MGQELGGALPTSRAVEDASAPRRPGRVPWLALAVALGATLGVFLPALRGALVYDDLWLVAQNPAIRSLATLPEALSGAYWDFIEGEAAARIGYWRPLTALALHVGYRLGGGAPWGFHLVSLVLHLGATALAVLLAWRLAARADVALFCGVLFGLHPAHVESVAWISAVNDPLHGIFCLAALLAFLSWRERTSPGPCVLAPVLFFVALLAKENAAALVPMLLALDFGRVRSAAEESAFARMRPLARAWLPFGAALCAYWLLRIAVFGSLGAGFERVTTHLDLPFLRTWSLRLEMLGEYIGLAFWPAKLNLFREIRVTLAPGPFFVALGWLALWTGVLFVLLRRRMRPELAALLCVPAGVLPALVRIQAIGRFPLSDRFLYLSVFGAALLVALLALRKLPRVPAFVLLGLLCAAAGWKCRQRIPFWKDELSVFATSALQNPRSMYAQWSLGRVLLEEYKRTQVLDVLDEAHRAFLRAQDLYKEAGPGDFVTRDDLLQANLGNGWFYVFAALAGHQEASFAEAEIVFDALVKMRPESEEALTGRGVARLYEKKLAEAEADLAAAAAKNAKDFGAWYWLGRARQRLDQPEKAAEAFERALALRPDDRETTLLLAAARAASGDRTRARELLARALAAWPDDTQVMLQLGRFSAMDGQPDTARSWFERALQRDGNFGPAHLELGKLYLLEGTPAALQEALLALDRACRLMPDDFEAHYNLGVVLARLGASADALPRLERALALDPRHPLAPQIEAEIARLRAELGR